MTLKLNKMTNDQKHIKFMHKLESSINAYDVVLEDAIKSRDNNKIEDLNDFYDGQVKKYQGKKDTAQELKDYYEYLFK
tara:strand:- start:477 stop:710 length:234 start_codon:yes stop_codon:yes gene_type:complete